MVLNNATAKSLLETFIHEEPARQWLSQPFLIENCAVASDAYSLLYFLDRLGGEGCEECKGDEINVKSIQGFIRATYEHQSRFSVAQFEEQTQPRMIDEVLEPDCPACQGEGFFPFAEIGIDEYERCEECNGEGVLEIRTGNKIPDPFQTWKIAHIHLMRPVVARIHDLFSGLAFTGEFMFHYQKATGSNCAILFEGGGLIFMPHHSIRSRSG